jgi:hypothetical protein
VQESQATTLVGIARFETDQYGPAHAKASSWCLLNASRFDIVQIISNVDQAQVWYRDNEAYEKEYVSADRDPGTS